MVVRIEGEELDGGGMETVGAIEKRDEDAAVQFAVRLFIERDLGEPLLLSVDDVSMSPPNTFATSS